MRRSRKFLTFLGEISLKLKENSLKFIDPHQTRINPQTRNPHDFQNLNPHQTRTRMKFWQTRTQYQP